MQRVLATHDRRVEASAADVLPDRVDQQQVDVGEGDRRHPSQRVGQEVGLEIEDSLSHDGFEARRVLVAPLDECDAGEEVAALDHDRHRVVDHVHPAELEHRPVVERGAFELPEPDGRHLCEAALDGAGEHRVGLHSVHDDDVVGLCGGLRVEDREAELRVGERHHVHPRVDRTAAEVLGDAKRREEIGLPCAVPPPWLPIAGTMNGAAPSPLNVDCRLHRDGDVAIPLLPAVTATRRLPHPRPQVKRLQRLVNPPRYVFDLRAAHRLAGEEERRKISCDRRMVPP